MRTFRLTCHAARPRSSATESCVCVRASSHLLLRGLRLAAGDSLSGYPRRHPFHLKAKEEEQSGVVDELDVGEPRGKHRLGRKHERGVQHAASELGELEVRELALERVVETERGDEVVRVPVKQVPLSPQPPPSRSQAASRLGHTTHINTCVTLLMKAPQTQVPPPHPLRSRAPQIMPTVAWWNTCRKDTCRKLLLPIMRKVSVQSTNLLK
mmetsp:Transcript_32854/g.109683  ORF Transcript_32854/g.109683 Transcript_32854/m.109683 type:complete len:211 (-) Transcript_32854:493-1125(-)